MSDVKALSAILVPLVLASAAHADWNDLRLGMAAPAATHCVGVPLMSTAARGYDMWTYDAGGYILFEGGVISYWHAPRPGVPPGQPPSAVPPPAAPEARGHADVASAGTPVANTPPAPARSGLNRTGDGPVAHARAGAAAARGEG